MQPAGDCCAHTYTKLRQISLNTGRTHFPKETQKNQPKWTEMQSFPLSSAYKTLHQGLSQLKVPPEMMAVALREAKITL